jgi:hypothetical protein
MRLTPNMYAVAVHVKLCLYLLASIFDPFFRLSVSHRPPKAAPHGLSKAVCYCPNQVFQRLHMSYNRCIYYSIRNPLHQYARRDEHAVRGIANEAYRKMIREDRNEIRALKSINLEEVKLCLNISASTDLFSDLQYTQNTYRDVSLCDPSRSLLRHITSQRNGYEY